MRDVLLSDVRRMTNGNEAIAVGAGRVVGLLIGAVWRKEEQDSIRISNKAAIVLLPSPWF